MAAEDKALLTLGAYQAGIEEVTKWTKQYVQAAIQSMPTPVDPTTEQVKTALDQLNGEVIGTTAFEKVSASRNYKDQIKSILDSLGFVDTGKFRLYPSMIAQATMPSGVFIEDTTGALWTASNWTALHTSEVAYSIVVITSARSFRMALTHLTSKNNGTNITWYGVPQINVVADTYNETMTPLDETKAIVANYAPAILGMDSNNTYSKERLIANLPSTCHYFETVAEMQATQGEVAHLYIVNNGGTTDGTGMHTYYWGGDSYIDNGSKPITIPSTNYGFWLCYSYKATATDTTQWFQPNMTMIRDMYNNKSAIQAAYKAVTGSNFTEASVWSCQQANGSNCWSFYLNYGSTSNGTKTYTNYVIPCAAYTPMSSAA